MIKEKKKITKYNYKKSLKVLLLEYFRTIFLSILFAAIFSVSLSIHARNEMIKNLYANAEDQKKIEKQMAENFIKTNSDLLKNIKNQKYIICMHIGKLYETVGDYQNAQIAFESAVEKSKPGNYVPYQKLIEVLAAQEKFDEINKIMLSIKDRPNKTLIKFKTRSYIIIGDKYYSIGKSLSAAKSYEKAKFYYDKFKKKDSKIEESINNRITNAYIKTADNIVKLGYNTDAVNYLKKVEKYRPSDLKVKYKLGIILSDSDPEQAIKYLEPLLDKIPQHIDYGVYCTALMKAANIADLDGRTTQAKTYRYKIHSMDMFLKRKVIYKNDIDTELASFILKKVFFTYPIKLKFKFYNKTGDDIKFLDVDFVLTDKNDKAVETVSSNIARKGNPLIAGGYDYNEVLVKFKKKFFTKRDLENYTIKIYAYKDEKFKSLIAEIRIPQKSIK